MNELLGATVSGAAGECNGRPGNRELVITHRQPATVRGYVHPEPMAQTRQLWAHCLVADDRDGAMTPGEAIATDSLRREREKGECGLWRLTRESEAATVQLSLLAHA